MDENQTVQDQLARKGGTGVAVAHAEVEPNDDPELDHAKEKGNERPNPLENSPTITDGAFNYIPVLP